TWSKTPQSSISAAGDSMLRHLSRTMCHSDDIVSALRRMVEHLKPKALLEIPHWLMCARARLTMPRYPRLYRRGIGAICRSAKQLRLLEKAEFSVPCAEELADATDLGSGDGSGDWRNPHR